MINPAKAAEVIKAFLSNPIAQPDTALSEAAAAYAAACRSVNARIDRCVEFLDAGLRTEAIFWAEEFPPLFDLYRVCDIPGSDAWAQAAEMNSTSELVLEVPPALRRHDMQRINHAYNEEERIRPLLRRQRRLALGGASIRDRLDVLRSLLQADPTHPSWPDDVAEMETARREEVKDEFARASAANDYRTLDKLEEELATPNWSDEKLNAPLLAKIREARTKLRQQHIVIAYDQLIPKLEAAHASLASAEAVEYRWRWESILQKSGIAPSAQQTARVEPVFAWLDREADREQKEQEFATACAALTKSLDNDAPDIEIERRLRAVEKFGMGVPERLHQMVEQKLATRQAIAKRAFRVKITVIVSIAMLIVLAAGWGLYSRAQRQREAEWSKRIREKIDKFEFKAARKLFSELEQQDPRRRQQPEFVALAADLDQKESKENTRLEQLNSLWEQYKKEGKDFSAWPELKKLARTDEEKDRVQKADEQRTREVRQEFKDRQDKIAQHLKSLKEDETKSEKDFHASYKAYQKEIADLQNWTAHPARNGRIEEKTLARLDFLRTDGETVAKEAKEAEERRQVNRKIYEKSMSVVTAAIEARDIDRFTCSLRDFTDTFPQEAQANGWTKVAPVLPVLRGWIEADRLQTLLSSMLMAKETKASKVEKGVKEVKNLLASNVIKANSEEAKWLKSAADHMKRCIRILDKDVKSEITALNRYLESKLIGNIYWYEEKDGFCAYMENPAAVDQKGDRVIITHFKTKRTDRTDEIKRNVPVASFAPELAPHSRFAVKLRQQLAKVTDEDATTFFLRRAQECLDEKSMDAIVRIEILRRLLDLSSSFVDEATSQELRSMQERVLSIHKKYAIQEKKKLVDWWLTQDPDIKQRKGAISAVLLQIGSPGKIADEQEKRLAELKKNQPHRVEWAGCLLQNPEGQWRLSGQPTTQGKLIALMPSGGEAELKIDTTGLITNKTEWFNGQPVLRVR